MNPRATDRVHVVHDEDRTAASERADLLDEVCAGVERLLDSGTRTPRRLSVHAGDVAVDVEWPEDRAAATAGPVPAAPAPEEPEPAGDYLTAQAVGVFYRGPEPGAPPFVAEGDTVVPGQQVGILEAMKLMMPVHADRPGRIATVIVADGDSVEYGDRLFALAAGDAP